MKEILLLGIMLFLISAPPPDANTIAEITANFIVPNNHAPLTASDQQTEFVYIREEQSG